MSTTTPDQTTDRDDWKQKYRDTVRELDTKEGRWRDDETRLHKNLLRLSFSYLGRNAELDRQLKQLQSSLKQNPDPELRARLIDGVVGQITRLTADDNATGPALDSSAGIMWLVEKLQLPDTYARELELITARLTKNESATLEENSTRLADLINDVVERREETKRDYHGDTFVDFLNKISLPGPLGSKVATLQKRSAEIETDLERLAVIDDTIALLSEELGQDVPHGVGASETQAIVRELIEWMTLPSQVKEELANIQSRLDTRISAEELSSILRDLGYTVSQFHGSLMSELTDVEYYLKNIAIRLKELQLGIEDSFKDQRESLDEQEGLNSGIAEQVVQIATKLADESDLNEIKHLIDDGLNEIRSRMNEHLARDRERVANGEDRLKLLSNRLKKMDEESTQLRAQVRLERDRAQRDALTGIPNRAAYDERLTTEISRRNRHGRRLSLAVIDIDKFKDVNDKLGHKAGDKVLKNVAEICAAIVRTSDFLARYGGEEFALVLPETALEQARLVAEKLRGEIAAKGFFYDSRRVPITVSIGVAEFASNETADEVFQRADRALYAAKERGRNRCVTESEIDG